MQEKLVPSTREELKEYAKGHRNYLDNQRSFLGQLLNRIKREYAGSFNEYIMHERKLQGQNVIADLSNQDLYGLNLENANLQRVKFRRADLREANLFEADLFEADFRGAYLSKADLTKANLTGACLENADLTKANLTGANLCGANFTLTMLHEANLCGANFTRARLHEANLSKANLRGADLFNADLYEADLYEADLYEANLRGANLFEASLFKADLFEANLFEANLRGANLSQANLTGAWLENADLQDVSLVGAKLRGTILFEEVDSRLPADDLDINDHQAGIDASFAYPQPHIVSSSSTPDNAPLDAARLAAQEQEDNEFRDYIKAHHPIAATLLFCPFIQDITLDPASIHGMVFDWEGAEMAINYGKEGYAKNPLTNEPFKQRHIYPNLPMKNLLDDLREKYKAHKEEQAMTKEEGKEEVGHAERTSVERRNSSMPQQAGGHVAQELARRQNAEKEPSLS